MQEHQVTVGGQKHKLAEPFFVLATQNPIEQEGTYPLPEAQLDRFMFNVLVDYPNEEEEFTIVRQTTAAFVPQITATLSQQEVTALQAFVRKVPVADHVIRYAMQFARLTRASSHNVPDFIRNYVSWGAGPRASQYLILGAKARAVLRGRPCVSTEDVLAVARPVLRHRIITNFNAEAEGIKPDDIVDRLAELVSRDLSHTTKSNKLPGVFKSAASP
jgi:MoxR-like ATPase